ncbi:MAG TPA: hypothetical protein DCG75_10435 [Bacteroidales bacterium]|nr:hypothetical protein [Bacteroidales bacterium]
MKKIVFLLLVSLSATIYAQDDNLPESITKAFSDKFPNLKIDNWTSNNEQFYIEFYLKGTFYTSVFDEKGQWIETSEIISDSDIPPQLKDYLNRNYSSGEIAYSEKVENPKSVYFIRVNYSLNDQNIIIKCNLNGSKIEILENLE